MAKLVLTDAKVLFGASDVSAYIKSVAITYSADVPDGTTMGATTHTRLAGGLKDWSMSFEALNDFAASALDSIVFPLVGTSVALEVRPASGSRSTSNPAYTGSAILDGYNPLGQSVGAEVTAPITFKAAGALSRQTS